MTRTDIDQPTTTGEEVNRQLLKSGEVIVKGHAVRARQVANQLALKRLEGKVRSQEDIHLPS